MDRYKRTFFFQAPADNSGDKFITKNIPTELTMRQFTDSIGFISEVEDGATTTQQGFVKIHTDDTAINNRNIPLKKGPITPSSTQKVLVSHQSPSTGVFNGISFQESNPSTTSSGVPVKAKGIKVTGMVHDTGILKRIGYALEFNGETLPDFPTLAGAVFPIKFVVNSGKQDYLYTITPSTSTDKTFKYEHRTRDKVWYINHRLDKFPSVTVTDSDKNVIYPHIKYTDENNVVITHSSLQTGWVFFN